VFAFSAAGSVKSPFAGSIENATASKSHGSTGETFKVGMNCEGCIDKPMNDIHAVGRENEFIVPGFRKKDNEA